ncbi:hypothetical protein F4778DRAFT_53709 [Xylariomycetidae sp. FL2044]|nr:hypothetical protein F4778DRAFT_53709 [Xylariomycetidae sp. FL2044]
MNVGTMSIANENGMMSIADENGTEPAADENGTEPAAAENGAEPAAAENGAEPTAPENGAELAAAEAERELDTVLRMIDNREPLAPHQEDMVRRVFDRFLEAIEIEGLYCPLDGEDYVVVDRSSADHANLMCPVKGCGAFFTNKHAIPGHMVPRHVTIPGECPCKGCDQKLETKRGLIEHITAFHMLGEVCQAGGCTFWEKDEYKMAAHVLEAHGPKYLGKGRTNPYKCCFGTCTKRYDSASSANRHARWHQYEASHLL